MKKIIIFDLDGTLLNTLEDLADSTNYALKQFKYETRTVNEIRDFVGNGVAKLIERAIPKGRENPNYKECLRIFKDHYAKNMFNKTQPYPNIINTLKKIKSEGTKIAVVSNKFDLAVKELCDKYFPDLIDISTGENEKAGIRKKPAPDAIFKILKQFDIKKEDAIYIGDSEVDIQTAQNASLPCISVAWGFKTKKFLHKNKAEIIIDKPQEIMKYL